jgi:hypothetical protein
MQNIKDKIKKYFVDFVIITGILILSYNIFRQPTEQSYGLPKLPKLSGTIVDYHTGWKVFGIFLIAIGVDIVVRKYFRNN